MLRQRIVTALVLLPLILGPLLLLPTAWLYAYLVIPALIGAWEWTALMGLRARGPRVAYLLLMAVLLAAAWLAERAGQGRWVLAAGALWWLYAFRLVTGFPENFARAAPGVPLTALFGALMLVPAMVGLAVLHGSEPGGVYRLFFLFGLVWAADIGAYFAGRRFGRHKLAPGVSPGKTIEGALGGFAAALLVALAAPAVFGVGRLAWPALLLLVALVVAASIVGDLTESLFKRHRGVKDSGTLLPGHGGVLDRIDSLLAAAPVLALGLALQGV